MYFHPHPEFGTFSSASQVQLDVSYDEIGAGLKIRQMQDENGESIEAAPHPQQILRIRMDQPVEEGWMLRKEQ